MSIASLALSQTYIGRFEVTDTEINWFPEHSWSWYRDFGDMVYFMFVNEKLMKIGKACGWNARVGMYKNGAGPRGDATNKRMTRIMNEINKSEILTYAIRCPRLNVSFTNPLNGDTVETELEIARSIEKTLTSQYLSENVLNTLSFSKQLK